MNLEALTNEKLISFLPQIRLTGLKEHISNHTVAAEFRTITEGLCPLAEIYQQRDFVHLLNVAVSYDGVHASNEEHLYAFDSTCQTADVIDGEVKFSLTVSLITKTRPCNI